MVDIVHGFIRQYNYHQRILYVENMVNGLFGQYVLSRQLDSACGQWSRWSVFADNKIL